MPKSFDISILGDKALAKAFGKLPLAMERRILKQAFKVGAQKVKDAAVTNIPRVTGRKTDPLRRLIQIRSGKRSRGKLTVIVRTPPRERLGIPASAKYYYPAIIEYGAPRRTVAGYHFLQKARDATEPKVLEAVRADIRRSVAEAVP